MKRGNAKSLGAKVLAVPMLAALVLMFGLTGPASATVESEADADIGVSAEGVLDGIDSGEITLHAPESSLDVSETTVQDVDSGEGTYTAVTLPVKGSYAMLSNLTVVFDETGNVANYSETLYQENSEGNFQLTQYSDGELTQDEDMQVGYMSDAELIEDMENSTPVEAECLQQDAAEAAPQSVGAVASCIAGSLGVGGVVAYLIAGACAGSCVGQIYPVCAACIGGYAALGSASIGAVAACFQLL